MPDTKESFEVLEDASGNGASLSKSEAGDSATGKVGLTAFGYKDLAGNLVLPPTEITTPSLSQAGQVVRPLPFEPQKYAAATGGFAIAASATDVFRILGSNSKTVRVKKLVVSGRTTSGSPVAVVISLIKRSTANTGGTSVASTLVPMDSNNSAATASVNRYTANPTLGTEVGRIASHSITFQRVGLSPLGQLVYEFETPIVLRGSTEQLSVNFNATSVTGSSVACYVEWEEV